MALSERGRGEEREGVKKKECYPDEVQRISKIGKTTLLNTSSAEYQAHEAGFFPPVKEILEANKITPPTQDKTVEVEGLSHRQCTGHSPSPHQPPQSGYPQVHHSFRKATIKTRLSSSQQAARSQPVTTIKGHKKK